MQLPPKCNMYFHYMNWTIKILLLITHRTDCKPVEKPVPAVVVPAAVATVAAVATTPTAATPVTATTATAVLDVPLFCIFVSTVVFGVTGSVVLSVPVGAWVFSCSLYRNVT